MNSIGERELRQRGFYGSLCLMIFFGFNALMVLLLLLNIFSDSLVPMHGPTADASADQMNGILDTRMFLAIWVSGFITTGVLAFATRGSKRASH